MIGYTSYTTSGYVAPVTYDKVNYVATITVPFADKSFDIWNSPDAVKRWVRF